MDDVIYRLDTVNELREYITEPSISDDNTEIIGYNDGIELAISVLSTMPSAQKKRTLETRSFEIPKRNYNVHLSLF